ncbi:MAG: hypothetical protein ACRDN6_05360 [Gaiellaceae bacterium]
MRAGGLVRRFVLGVAVLALLGSASVFTAGNSVPVTYASQTSSAITVQDKAPASCAGMGLTSVVSGTTGTAANDLLLGGAANETMLGNPGDDCVLGGGGDDTLRGEQGSDVCIGGPGTDSFHASCETQIQ